MRASSSDIPRDILVIVNPFSNFMSLTSLHIIEKLGGDLVTGEMNFHLDTTDDEKLLEKAITTQTGKISITRQNGDEFEKLFEIPFFIESRTNSGIEFNYKIICIDDIKFLSKTNSITFNNIEEAIRTLYPAKKSEPERIDLRVKPDIGIEKLKLIQFQETDYSLCNKLLYSYKKNTVFSFGFSGLMLKDLCGINNSRGKKESIDSGSSCCIVVDSSKFVPLQIPQLNYDRLLNNEPIKPYEEIQDTPVNCKAARSFFNYGIRGTGYENLTDNYNYNTRLMNSNLYSSLVVEGYEIPNYRIGDVVGYVDTKITPQLTIKNYLCYSNEFFFSKTGSGKRDKRGDKISWVSVFLGFKPGKWSENNTGE